MKHLTTICDYYSARADSAADAIEQVIDRMLDMDMPEQEIISILLPIDHPLNGPEGRS